jgi:GTPase SAR1 family protein
MSDGDCLKICVVGPSGVGKTLLARTLGGQVAASAAYSSTVAVRVQQVTHNCPSGEAVAVNLFEASGDSQQHWPVLSPHTDGLLLCLDPSQPDQVTR